MVDNMFYERIVIEYNEY